MVDAPGVAELVAAGIDFEVLRFEIPASVEESAARQGIDIGALIKTLLIRLATDDYVFVLVPGDRQMSWPKLRAHLGVTRSAMPDGDEAKAVTGYERGAITPLGAQCLIDVVADASIAGKVSIGGGARGVAVHLSASSLLEHLGAVRADVTEAPT